MGETLFDSVAVVGIEGEHFAEQIEAKGIRRREQSLPRLLASFGEGLYEV